MAPAPQPGGGADQCPPGRLRVAVASVVPMVESALRSIVAAAPDLVLWRGPGDVPPHVVLCAAASAAGLRRCQELLPLEPWPPAVLYDLEDQLGPVAAGLGGFHGYMSGTAPTERLLDCARRVARGQIDAQRGHIGTLVLALREPPLDAVELRILQYLAWGWEQKEIWDAPGLPKGTFEDYLKRLTLALGARSGQHAGTIAVALSLVPPFEGEPPDLAQAGLIPRRRRRRNAAGPGD